MPYALQEENKYVNKLERIEVFGGKIKECIENVVNKNIKLSWQFCPRLGFSGDTSGPFKPEDWTVNESL